MPAEARFPAMGGEAHVAIVGDPSLMHVARRRLGDLEDRWTRFRNSELVRMNALAGVPARVSDETFVLVQRSIAAWRATGGAFDPTVLGTMVGSGYDRTFDAIGRDPRPAGDGAPSPGPGGVLLDARARTVTLPAGVGIDPGGIGKGLAADIVSEELLQAGAEGALVSVGGDLRVRGAAPSGASWTVTVQDPYAPAREMARLALADGGVATSSRLRRRWRRGGRELHHLVDPATGRPADGAVDAATVVAGAAWWAEALATAAVVGGRAEPVLGRASTIVVEACGRRVASDDLRAALR